MKGDFEMSEPFVLQNETALFVKVWSNKFTGLRAGISTRNGGVSELPFESLNLGLHVNDKQEMVIQNREIFAKQNNILIDNWICPEQIHGNQIKKVSKADIGKGVYSLNDLVEKVDGLYTLEKGITLTAGFADCVPLFFFAPNQKLIGIAHAGWKGTVGNIVKAMVNAWEQEGVAPSEIHTVIGPSICHNCYIVDNVVIRKVDQALHQDSIRPYEEITSGQFLLDLKELNKQLMIQAGILLENIEITSYCTSCHNDIFFSHRKERGATGRMMAFITLTH